MNRTITILALLALLAIPMMLRAQFANGDTINPCHVKASCSTYGAAKIINCDSYLADQPYSGNALLYGHENFRNARTGKYMWKYRTCFNGILGTAGLYDSNQQILMLKQTWSGYYSSLSKNSQFLIGPIIELAGGATYMSSNSNNPVSVKLRTSLGASGMLLMKYPMRTKDLIIRMQLDYQLLGAAFAPAYGQSYYEIFGLGNYDNLIHLSHPGNTTSWCYTMSIDIPLGKKQKNTLRISYTNDNYTSIFNELNTCQSHKGLSLGFVKTLYKIKGKSPLKSYNPYL